MSLPKKIQRFVESVKNEEFERAHVTVSLSKRLHIAKSQKSGIHPKTVVTKTDLKV